MIPLRLQISGFLSYREPVYLDLTDVQLACISGPNGAGKSSLLDAITWALFGEARRRDDAIINGAKDVNAAEVILDFEYESLVYRIRRYKPKLKTGLLEFSIQSPEGDWKVLTEATTRQTEARIRQTLRLDYDTFINASFFLQGKADQFAQQKVAGRKKILGNILGLEKWETYRQAAVEQRKERESSLDIQTGEAKAIQDELAEAEERKAALKELEKQLESAAGQRISREAALQSVKKLEATLKEQQGLVEVLASQVQATQARCEDMETRLATRREERETYQQRILSAKATEAAYAQWQAARQKLEEWEEIAKRFREAETRRNAPLLEIEKARTALQTEQLSLLEQSKRAETDQKTYEEQSAVLQQARTELALLENRLASRTELEADRNQRKESLGGMQNENIHLREEMKTLKERIETLKAASGADCPLCGQALEQDDRLRLIAELTAQGTEMGDRFRANENAMKEQQAAIAALNEELVSLGQAEKEHLHLARTCSQLEEQLSGLKKTLDSWTAVGEIRLKEVNSLLESGKFALEAHSALAAVNAELKAMGYDAAAHDTVRAEELAGRESEGELRALESARSALAPLEREIGELEKQLSAARLEWESQQAVYQKAAEKLALESATMPDGRALELDLQQAREQENSLRTQVGAARQKVEVLKNLRARLKDIETQQDDLRLEIARLKTLEHAFGNNGIPALLIEQALPEIEEHANEILDRLTGGSLNVRFLTQRDFKDKKRDDKREALDIIISDANGERDYELYSGGEAFRVNFAIRLALSKVLAHRAGARLQTLVIDEGFGSQDAEGRQKLIEAINQVRTDFALILVITHLEELKDAFPARIEVEKTSRGSRVQVVVP